MKEINGNIWNLQSGNLDSWIVIPTNGFVRQNSENVMGRGLALQAARKYPHLPLLLGRRLEKDGNRVYAFSTMHLFTFPVKHHFYEAADIKLIRISCQQIRLMVLTLPEEVRHQVPVYLPRVGCGNGKLKWENVKPILAEYLDDRFTVVSWEA